ncbi:MAG: baseplate J/gp47 family protein [Desulfuromonadales bacterium]|nr:baseplate J/gp47 family protein [Desulfuromonadales bacterium]
MSSFGVTPTGFVAKTVQDILDDIEAGEKTDFGSDINVGAESILGQINGVIAAALAENWEVLNAVYRSLYPGSATDEALDNVAAITGVSRLPATRSSMVVTCTGTPGTPLAANRVVSTGNNDRYFSLEAATIGGGGTVDVEFQSEEFGPIPGVAQTLTIETPVAGWTSAANAADADFGRELETDADFRLRREELLAAQGNATLESIRADLLSVDDVERAFVYENPTDVTDGRNLPPKSVEAIVTGGDDLEVATALFNSKAAGIQTYGHPPNDVTETVTDSQGVDHTVNFTRGDEITIYFRVEVDVTSDYPATGDQDIKDAIAAFGQTLGAGDDVISEKVQSIVFSVEGVFDLTLFYLDTTSPPTGTANIPISVREIADIQTANITVVSTPV